MTNELKRCFEILEVSPDATYDEAKAAYRLMVQVWHPDKYSNNDKVHAKATSKFKELNNAWSDAETYFKHCIAREAETREAELKVRHERERAVKEMLQRKTEAGEEHDYTRRTDLGWKKRETNGRAARSNEHGAGPEKLQPEREPNRNACDAERLEQEVIENDRKVSKTGSGTVFIMFFASLIMSSVLLIMTLKYYSDSGRAQPMWAIYLWFIGILILSAVFYLIAGPKRCK
jgi:hypothetical protein